MPVLTLECPDCGHVFKGMFLAATKPPEKWFCSQCRGENARPLESACRRSASHWIKATVLVGARAAAESAGAKAMSEPPEPPMIQPNQD